MLSLILTSFIVITFSYLFKLIQDMEKKLENYKNKIDEDVLEGNLKCLGTHELDDWAIEIFSRVMEENHDVKEEVDKLLENEMEYIASKDDIEELKDDIDNIKNEFATCNELSDYATEDYVDKVKDDLEEHFNKSILPSINEKIEAYRADFKVDVFNLFDDIRHIQKAVAVKTQYTT